MSRVSLTKDFFLRHNEYEGEQPKKIDTFTNIELVACWSLPFSIEKEVTFGDLLRLLKTADESLITFIEMATDCNLKPFLKDERPSREIPEGMEHEKLIAVEVARTYELSNYDLGTHVMQVQDYCSGIGKDPDGQEINYAIEFTPWIDLVDLPLRISNKSRLHKVEWEKVEPHPIGKTMDGKDVPWMSDRGVKNTENVDILTEDMRLGDFFCALLNELCFFGSPQRAEQKSSELEEAMKDVEEIIDLEEQKKKKELN